MANVNQLLPFTFTMPKSNLPQQFKYTTINASAAKSTEHSDFQLQSKQNSPSAVKGWAAFAKNVSGEWDGFGAEFTKEGTPIELPEYVVPEAYREWEVKVFDWQTQCPTLAVPDDDDEGSSFMYKSIRLLPTVGCEADAATRYSIEERNITAHNHHQVSAFAYQPTGCYVAAWSNNSLLELEHCLVDPQDRRSRVRIIQVLRLQHSKFQLQTIKVFCEHWYGPFQNGNQLGGCAVINSAFASTQPLDPAHIIGVWEGQYAISTFHNNSQKVIQELVDDTTRKTIRDEVDLILLPKQLWCTLKDIEGGETCCEVGWLLVKERAMTSKCTFSDSGELKEIAVSCESAAYTR